MVVWEEKYNWLKCNVNCAIFFVEEKFGIIFLLKEG
jgi:hypothetical protein